jgi:hypothetical protein
MQAPTTMPVWPVTVAGWVSFIAAIMGTGIVVFGWGRFIGRLDKILETITTLNQKISMMDDVENRTETIEHVLWGPRPGDTGLIHEIHHISRRLDGVERRHGVRRKEDMPSPEES